MDIKRILNLTYDEYVKELKEKYGEVQGNYFLNNSFRSKNKRITRGNEGLYIHHIDEDKTILLSNPLYAKMDPFSYQHADRLVYCNLLEHLILHIKIIKKPHKDKNPNEDVGVGGAFHFIIPELNDIYSGIKFNLDWKNKVIENIINYEKEYLECIKYLMNLKRKFPLVDYLKSFNKHFNLWDNEKNSRIYSEITKVWQKINNK